MYFLKCMLVLVNFQILRIYSEHLFIEDLLAKKQPTEVSIKKGVLKNFSKFTEKHLCVSILFNKAETCKFTKKEARHRCFPVNFAKFLRTPYL